MKTKLQKMMLGAGVMSVLALSPKADIVLGTTITGQVYGTASLYYDAWGHPYSDALNRGTPATSLNYAFSSGQAFSIAATGCVVDAGSFCTSPDGLPGIFRGLTVYALIGIWSTSATSINPVGSAFVVGSANNLVAPTGSGSFYLFLADNDGVFEDNPPQYFYTVTVPVPGEQPAVPEPGTYALFGLGIAGLLVGRRKLRRSRG